MNGKKSAEVFTAFAIGMGIGAAVGILFAPQSGEETRDYLVKGARDRFDDAAEHGTPIRATRARRHRTSEVTGSGTPLKPAKIMLAALRKESGKRKSK